MQPAWRHFRRDAVAFRREPEARVAGVVAPRSVRLPAGERLVLPSTRSDFTTAATGSAFWWVSAEPNGLGGLWRSSGARVVADLRGELGLAPRPAMWTPAVVSTLRDRLAATGSDMTRWAVPASGDALHPSWLRAALWFTYHREEFGAGPGVVELPPSFALPRVGADLGGPGEATTVTDGLQRDELSPDPWRVSGPEITVGGGGGTPATTPTTSDGGGSGWLLALAAAWAALSD